MGIENKNVVSYCKSSKKDTNQTKSLKNWLFKMKSAVEER